MIKKIYTHPEPRHIDDFFAVSYLCFLFKIEKADYIHPQQVPSEYLENPEIALIDVGMSYCPEKNNFDHHQDLNLPCSLVLVLKHFSDDVPEFHPVITIIDHIDRFGFVSASREFQIPYSEEIDRMRKTFLLLDPAKYSKHITRAFLLSLEYSKSYNSFIENIYRYLDSLKLLDIPKEIIAMEEKEFLEKVRDLKIFETGGLRIGYLPHRVKDFGKIFKKFDLDILISVNVFSEKQTSVIRNSFSEKQVDLSKICKVYPVSFIHKGNFLVVVDLPVEEVSPQKIVDSMLNPDSIEECESEISHIL